MGAPNRLLVPKLPPPPPGRTGWPWTEESESLPETMPYGKPWPKISIVTPSYNQGQFLEETIRSVLLQGYPNLEYMIIDGGSNDNSLEIIKKYAPWLTYWVSEPDKGQSHAINKGFTKATGDIVTWICSSDSYLPKAFQIVSSVFSNNPSVGAISGSCNVIDENGKIINTFISEGFGLNHRLFNPHIPQPATFMPRSIIDKIGLLNEKLHYTMDFELWLRIFNYSYFSHIQEIIANLREHDDSKSMYYIPESLVEKASVLEHYFSEEGLRANHIREEFSEILLGYANRCIESNNYAFGRKLFYSAFRVDPQQMIWNVRNIKIIFKLILGAKNVNIARRLKGLFTTVEKDTK